MLIGYIGEIIMKKYSRALPKEVLWDESVAESLDGVRVQMHRPVRKGTVLKCDAPWEGKSV